MFRAFLTATIAAGIVAISATAFAQQLGTAQEAWAAAGPDHEKKLSPVVETKEGPV
jgi:hypothetical protein